MLNSHCFVANDIFTTDWIVLLWDLYMIFVLWIWYDGMIAESRTSIWFNHTLNCHPFEWCKTTTEHLRAMAHNVHWNCVATFTPSVNFEWFTIWYVIWMYNQNAVFFFYLWTFNANTNGVDCWKWTLIVSTKTFKKL